MAIRIVNVRGFNTPEQRAGVVYVGRAFAGWKGHRLTNPFRPNGSGSAVVLTCLDRYCDWLAGQIATHGPGLMESLWEECEQGAKPLGCWCVNAVVGDGQPLCCHAQVLGRWLQKTFYKENDRG